MLLAHAAVIAGALRLLGAACPPSAACRNAAPCVVLDPGHPSEVSDGRRLWHGTSELAVTWIMAQRLTAALCHAGVDVLVTRGQRDSLMTNRSRAEFANRSGARLFIRLHTDAAPTRGFTVYFPDRRGTHGTDRGPTVAIRERSRLAAQAFYVAMSREMAGSGVPARGARGESQTAVGARQGALTGSIYANLPVITVEMVTLSDPEDAAVVQSEAGATILTRALLAGSLAALDRLQKPAATHKTP